MTNVEALASAAAGMAERAAASDWRGSDPYDGLWWPWPALLRAGPRRRQVIVQLHARAPFDVRRIYPGERPRIAKALALFARASLRLDRLSTDAAQRRLARDAAALIDADRSAGEAAWGYPFDVQTRWSYYPAGSPNVIVTTFAGLALREACEALGEPAFGERARGGARWALDSLYRPDAEFFDYHEGSNTLVHNANLLGARLVDGVLGPDAAPQQVGRAVERTLAAQRPDGSFPYGAEDNLGFVDSFHTGFVLGCLAELRHVDAEVDRALHAGAEFYASRFFGPDGAAWLWPQKPFPVDGHATGTGLSTLAALALAGLIDIRTLEAAADFALRHMVRRDRAVHRRYRLGAAPVRYIRWCDGHVALGLADAATALANLARHPEPGAKA
jgi:hypothetical protein